MQTKILYVLILNFYVDKARSSSLIPTGSSYFQSTICFDYLSTVDDTNQKLVLSSYGYDSITAVVLETISFALVAVVNPACMSIL